MSKQVNQIITLLGSIDLSLRKLCDAADRRAANRTRSSISRRSAQSFRSYNPKFDHNGPCPGCNLKATCKASCRDLDVFKLRVNEEDQDGR